MRSSVLCVCVVVALRPATALAEPAAPANPPHAREHTEATHEPQLVTPTLHALGLMTVMRATEAYLWPHPFAETNTAQIGRHYHRAFTMPPLWDWSQPPFRQDGDRWHINVIGHGAFGSELYLRARTCRQTPWQALLFTAVASATWEYGFEANGTRPSGLDLLFTPASGLVLGEARYFGWRSARSLDRGPLRSALTVLFDPFGELERALGTPC